MKAFDHYSPQTLAEALDLLARFNGRGHAIAGGTDLLLKMQNEGLSPEVLIDLKRLPELMGIDCDPKVGLRLGALVTLREITRSRVLQKYYPSLVQTAELMASEQVRAFATLGGNLCNASPAADLAPPLMVLNAQVCLVSRSGERWLPLEDFFHSPGRTALQPGELLKEIHLPQPGGASLYLKHSHRSRMDIAIVGVAIYLGLDDGVCNTVRIVLGAVAPVPLRAKEAEFTLSGQALTEERIAATAKVASQECQPVDDVRGSAWYRRRMVEVLVSRGLTSLYKHQ